MICSVSQALRLPAWKLRPLKAAPSSTQLRTPKPRLLKLGSSPGPMSPLNPKRKTTVPPGTSRFEAGAANVSALEALASNTGGDEIDERFASSHLITSTLMKQVSPSTVERRQLEPKQPLRFWLPKIRLAKQSLHTLCPRRAWTRRTILWTH